MALLGGQLRKIDIVVYYGKLRGTRVHTLSVIQNPALMLLCKPIAEVERDDILDTVATEQGSKK